MSELQLGRQQLLEFQLPAVMMTGYGTFDDAVRAMRLGAVDFFTKPVPIKDIAKAVAMCARSVTLLLRARFEASAQPMPDGRKRRGKPRRAPLDNEAQG